MTKQDTSENQAKNIFLGIGSNLGNRIANIEKAKSLLLQNNIMTQKDLMLKYNKHLTESEAESNINKNKEVNDEQSDSGQERSVFNRLLTQNPPTE